MLGSPPQCSAFERGPSPLSSELEPLSTSCFGSSNSPKLAEVSEIADDRGGITRVQGAKTLSITFRVWFPDAIS